MFKLGLNGTSWEGRNGGRDGHRAKHSGAVSSWLKNPEKCANNAWEHFDSISLRVLLSSEERLTAFFSSAGGGGGRTENAPISLILIFRVDGRVSGNCDDR